MELPRLSRRALGGTLSLAAVGLIAGAPALARAGRASTADIDILNVALGLEHEAIAAYQIGAESGLLSKEVLGVAVAFQGHHKAHRDALVQAITTLGGRPVAAKPVAEVAKALNASALRDQAGVLDLAAGLELGAVNAYLGAIPAFADRELALVAGRLAADETMHWTALTAALGRPLMQGALGFGG